MIDVGTSTLQKYKYKRLQKIVLANFVPACFSQQFLNNFKSLKTLELDFPNSHYKTIITEGA